MVMVIVQEVRDIGAIPMIVLILTGERDQEMIDFHHNENIRMAPLVTMVIVFHIGEEGEGERFHQYTSY